MDRLLDRTAKVRIQLPEGIELTMDVMITSLGFGDKSKGPDEYISVDEFTKDEFWLKGIVRSAEYSELDYFQCR